MNPALWVDDWFGLYLDCVEVQVQVMRAYQRAWFGSFGMWGAMPIGL